MAVVVVTDPGSGNDIFSNLQTAVNSLAANNDILIVPGTMRPNTGQIRTTKRFYVCTLVPATSTWVGFSNDFLPSNPITLINSAIWYRPESMSDSTLATGGGGGEPMAFFRFDDPAGSGTAVKYDYNTNLYKGPMVSDIEFRSKLPSLTGYTANGGPNPPSDNLSVAPDYGIYFNKSYNVTVTRCTFKYTGNAAIRYDHYNNAAGGVIYKNVFFHCAKGMDGLGLGYGIVIYGDNSDHNFSNWNPDPQYGSDNFLFIENNDIRECRHGVAGGGMGRYVIRYNYFEDNIITYYASNQSQDAHGRRNSGDGFFATHTVESYGNKIINTKYIDGTLIASNPTRTNAEDYLMERGIHLKEAMHLVYNNIISGCRMGIGEQLETVNVYNDSNTTYPQKCTYAASSAHFGKPMSHINNNSVNLLNGNCYHLRNYQTLYAGVYNYYFYQNTDYTLNAGPFSYTGTGTAGTGTAYTYPHNLRDDLNPPVTGNPRRHWTRRTFHSGR